MEFYKPTRKDLEESVRAAKMVSELTGSSSFFHWIDCLYCNMRYGCSPTQYLYGGFYKMRSFDRKKTYTKGRGYRAKIFFNDPKFVNICSNKVEFNKFFSPFIGRRWLYCKDVSVEDLFSFITVIDRIIVKPTNLSQGIGIYELDIMKTKEELSNELLGKDYLLEECIEQHHKMNFGNGSVNTLRVITVLDSLGEVHILKVCLRVGIGNEIVDNFSAGGIAYPIDLEYGRIEGPGSNKKMERFSVHPGSELYMVGLEVPYWEETLELVGKAAKQLRQIRFVGWDVAIAKDGPVLIECNSRPGAFLMEYIGSDKGLYKRIISYR